MRNATKTTTARAVALVLALTGCSGESSADQGRSAPAPSQSSP
jgi:hypothetical protein